MDNRVIEFISALRAAGVRISLAESVDALRAIEAAGIGERDMFRAALRATLIKESRDQGLFEEQFPLFFGTGTPPMPQQPGGGMSEEERQQMEQMLQDMLANMTPEQLRELFEAMMKGQPMSNQQMQGMLPGLFQNLPADAMPGSPFAKYGQMRLTRQAMRQLEFERLNELLQELLEKLRADGVSEQALEQLEQEARENQSALAQQLAEAVGQGMAREQANQTPREPQIEELMDRPFEQLSGTDAKDLRRIVSRLAARLRSRAALRQRRGNRGTLDAKSTIRANMRYDAVPIDVRHKRRHLKPKLLIICDRSRSTEEVVSFLLLLIYALQDQVSRTRSFAFIDTIHDISTYFAESRPELAIPKIMEEIQPRRSYSTDLGNSLKVFLNDFGGLVDHRTTVIMLGDARNNNNDPNIAAFTQLRARARRVIWFNPEPKYMWGRYDPGSLSSDMFAYAPLCDAVHEVGNMRQLVQAVDSLFS